ncbi:MAG: L,D-transpeptidase [Thermomicrobiales bacterium]
MLVLAFVLSGASIPATAVLAQDDTAAPADGQWVDPNTNTDGTWDDIGNNVSDAIDNAWDDSSGQDVDPTAADLSSDGAWSDPTADTAEPSPTYDANGNMIDPYTGAPLAIGADGTPIDATNGLYYDEAGNLIDPATGLAVSYDENGAIILPGAAPDDGTQAAPDDGTQAAADDGTQDGADEAAPELVTTPWLAPPPSGPPPGYSYNPPRTVYIPETSQTIDGVFLDVWREWGGAQSWGNPITPEFEENGHTVQYYDYGRFEYHPDDPGAVVQFGDLGDQMQPFLVRRASGSGSPAANEAALAARAWAPLDSQKVPPDSDTWRFVSASGHGVAGAFKSFWEATGEANYLGNPLTEPYKIDGVTYQVFERGKLSQQTGQDPALVPIGKLAVERWHLTTAPTDQGDLPVYDEQLFAAAPATSVSGGPVDPNGERWVQISISLQYLWAYQGDQVLWQGYISSGTALHQTPTGTFHVLSKLPVQTMEGVIGGEYYNVPDVPDVMYFTDFGHALHGTYWHNNFGTPMSHGCINLPMDVAEWMYQWAPLGMRVEIDP